MKKYLWIILVVALLGIGFGVREPVLAKANEFLYQSPCDKPLRYSIGRIDPQFNQTQTQFAQAITESSAIWSTAYGKQLFVYDPESSFTINLIYDSRQSLNTEINTMNSELEQKDTDLKPEIETYKEQSAILQRQIEGLNQKIQASNEKGGASEEEYNQLIAEQDRLRQEANELNSKAEALSQETQAYNSQIQQLDKKVNTYNDALSVKPEGGLYTYNGVERKIDIYIYDSRQELIHTLTHELGHALAIDHVNDPAAIMYERTNKNIILSPADIQALTVVCEKQNVINIGITNLASMIRQTMASFNTR